MNPSLLTAATTLSQLQRKVDIVSNNIANVNTPGYKGRQASFQDVLTQTMETQRNQPAEIGRITPLGVPMGLGAKLSATSLSITQGNEIVTDRDLDLMITGTSAWFRARSLTDDSEEVAYTRNGALQLVTNPVNGNEVILTTPDGRSVLDVNDQSIVFNAGYERLAVNEQGTLLVSYPSAQNLTFQLSLAKIARPDLLENIGDSQFRFNGNVDDLLDNGSLALLDLSNDNVDGETIRIKQGSLETSNVDLTQEMTELMTTQRAIQFQGRAISFADQMMGLANSIRG